MKANIGDGIKGITALLVMVFFFAITLGVTHRVTTVIMNATPHLLQIIPATNTTAFNFTGGVGGPGGSGGTNVIVTGTVAGNYVWQNMSAINVSVSAFSQVVSASDEMFNFMRLIIVMVFCAIFITVIWSLFGGWLRTPGETFTGGFEQEVKNMREVVREVNNKIDEKFASQKYQSANKYKKIEPQKKSSFKSSIMGERYDLEHYGEFGEDEETEEKE
jgi:hypothetical protein